MTFLLLLLSFLLLLIITVILCIYIYIYSWTKNTNWNWMIFALCALHNETVIHLLRNCTHKKISWTDRMTFVHENVLPCQCNAVCIFPRYGKCVIHTMAFSQQGLTFSVFLVFIQIAWKLDVISKERYLWHCLCSWFMLNWVNCLHELRDSKFLFQLILTSWFFFNVI